MFPRRDLKITFYRSSGPGGQRKNKVETAVRITHLPTGIIASATESRSQAQNRALALERLAVKLKKLSQKKKPRIKTSAPAAIKAERLDGKKRLSHQKVLRKKVATEQME
jgi:protein subunit release factor B